MSSGSRGSHLGRASWSGGQDSEAQHRILTTHTGSLIRPKELPEISAAKQKGEAIDEADFDDLLKKAVAEAVRRQADVGLDIVNDGEFGKSSWAAYVLERISGFELRRDQIIPLNWLGRDRERFRDFFVQECRTRSTARRQRCALGRSN